MNIKKIKAIGLLWIMFLLISNFCGAQNKDRFTESSLSVAVDTNKLFGTLTMPAGKNICPVMLLLAGSGPTDRDGNQASIKSDAYKQIAASLALKGIATVRYDKRGVGESVFNMDEGSLRFDQFIDDAVLWIKYLKNDKRFSKVVVAGHSEGSLIGMAACQKTIADAYISIAGAGKSIDEVLKIQLKNALPDSTYYIKCCHYLDTLKQGKLLTQADPALATLFRESIQPYMISWIKYSPTSIISKLTIPVLILQGETDIQVEASNAIQLSEANKKAKMKIIKGMNHALKMAEIDREKNFATYGDPNLPVVPELIQEIAGFILNK